MEDGEKSLRRRLSNVRIKGRSVLFALLGATLLITLYFCSNGVLIHALFSGDVMSVFTTRSVPVSLEVLSGEEPRGFDSSFPLLVYAFSTIFLFSLFSAVWIYHKKRQ